MVDNFGLKLGIDGERDTTRALEHKFADGRVLVDGMDFGSINRFAQ